jgi:hypothetical protein
MAFPAFSFSLGDFIAGIDLIRDLITALHDSAGAKFQYRRLIAELTNLECALIEIRDIKVDDFQKIALEQTVLQCQESIQDFLKRNEKFKTTLGTQTSGSKWSWRTDLRKIQWAMCSEDAVDELRAEITGHTLTINTLLMAAQLSVKCHKPSSRKQ